MTEPPHLTEMFDRALELRDQQDFGAAIALLEELISKLTPESRLLLAHSHNQIAHMYGYSENRVAQERHCRLATQIAPRFELASLGLFHALLHLDRKEDAIHELLRFVTLKDSPSYRELLEDGFDSQVSEERELLDRAWEHLEDHRLGRPRDGASEIWPDTDEPHE